MKMYPWHQTDVSGQIHVRSRIKGAWGSVALRCQSEGFGIDPQWCHCGFFPVGTDGSMCSGVDSASKEMSTRKTPGGKNGRCVRVTTLPPS
jgi:hypothetical protein